MTRTRLAKVSHRLGLVLAVPVLILAFLALLVAIFERPPSDGKMITYAGMLAVAAGLVYGSCRTVGRILGRFVGE